jgi:ankyrin repeat protein
MINQRDSHGRTPLHDACASGCPESVNYLLKAGADITAVDNNKRTPLHACAEFSDEQKIWTLLSRQNKASGHSIRDRFRPARSRSPSYEPWYAASRRGPSKVICSWTIPSTKQDSLNIGLVVRYLLSAGSVAGAEDSDRRTPLDVAIENDCREMVRAVKSLVEIVQNHWKIKPRDGRLQTVMALKSPLSVGDLQESARQEIIQNPSDYLPYLTLNDVEWVSKRCRDITNVDESIPPFSNNRSLLCMAVSSGLTELVESYGPLARINDDPKAILEQICKIPKDLEDNIETEYLSPLLYLACSRELSNMEMIEVLIEKCGVDVNSRALVKPSEWTKPNKSIEGGTALHALAKAHCWWQLEAARYLTQNGANIESINEKGETPLHVACTGPTYADMNCTNNVYGFWRIEFVKILLELGADLNVLDNSGLSCLHKASSSPQIMKILLEHGAHPAAGNISPIFASVQIQCLETLSILLDAGISPNTIDPNTGPEGFRLNYLVENQNRSRSALFCASFASLHNQQPRNSAPLVKLLVERGADVYASLNDTEVLIHYVFENAEYEIVNAFLDCSSKLDFNTRDSQGRNVFLAACDWRQCLPGYRHLHRKLKEAAPFLLILEFGADPLVVDNEGRNALHHLLDNPEMEEDAIIQFLTHDAAKTLLHQKDEKGFTPLHCSLRLLRPAVVQILLDMGANLLSPDPNGATALHHIAAQCLRVKPPSERSWCSRVHNSEYYGALHDLWKKYLAIGGSINVRDNAGSPPLFWYLSSGQQDHYEVPDNACCHKENFATYFSEEVIKDLDLHAINKNGENVLHIIAKSGKDRRTNPKHDKKLFEFFVGKGLSPLEEDTIGRSSLDIAAACEQKGIFELFQYRK